MRKRRKMSSDDDNFAAATSNRGNKVASIDKIASTQTKGQAALALTGSDPGTDYGGTPLSVANITRSFTSIPSTSVNVTTPSCMIYGMFPVDGFIYGWSKFVENNAVNDTTAATDNTHGRDDNLYPISQTAKTFDSNVWPVIENILSSGVGSRSPVSESAFVRHQSRVMNVYTQVLSAKWLNHMTYHYDWTKVFPYSPDAPAFLYKLALASRCDDIDFVKYWIPLLKRVETRTAFPDMINWIKRMMTPMMSSSLTGRVMIPINFIAFTTAQTDAIIERAQEDITYIDVVLSREDATIRSFIPFTLAGCDPWATNDVAFDINRHTAFWNSGKRSLPIFSPESTAFPLPDDRTDLVIGMLGVASDNNYEPRFIEAFAGRYPQVVWDEIRMTTLMGVGEGNSNEYFRQLTLARHGFIYFFGDGKFDEDSTGDYILWDGTQTDPDDPVPDWYQFRRFFESKHMDNKARFGTKDPEYLLSQVNGAAFARMIHLETEHLWMFQLLRILTTATAGNALRDMRSSIADLIVAKNNPPM